jgi:hypothetical protein
MSEARPTTPPAPSGPPSGPSPSSPPSGPPMRLSDSAMVRLFTAIPAVLGVVLVIATAVNGRCA